MSLFFPDLGPYNPTITKSWNTVTVRGRVFMARPAKHSYTCRKCDLEIYHGCGGLRYTGHKMPCDANYRPDKTPAVFIDTKLTKGATQ